MKTKKTTVKIITAFLIVICFSADVVNAQITQVENLFGKYALSVDGCENNSTSVQGGICPISINKPIGATLYKAYMVASQIPGTNPAIFLAAPLRINTTNAYVGSIAPNLSTLATSGSFISTTRYANVTNDLSTMLNTLPPGASTLYLMPDASQPNGAGEGLEGRTLLVIWNDPNGSDKVISIALGSTTSLPATTFTINTPPLDVTSPGSTAIAGLGINFSFGLFGQVNNFSVNNNLITALAGSHDDGAPPLGDGMLFTIGDDGDALNDTSEKYNIKSALVNGSTSYTATFENVMNHEYDYLSVYYSVVSGAFQTGTITGTLYRDDNTNFVLDAGETGLPANIDVKLYRDSDGSLGLNEATDQLVATVATDASGKYTFPAITVGTNYILKVNTADADIPSNLIIETNNPVLNVASINAALYTVNFGFVSPCSPSVNVTNNASICVNQTYTLPSGTIVNSAGVYIDTVRSAAGCDSIISTINLSVNDVSFTSLTDSIYEGQNYTLPSGITVHEAGTYLSVLTNSLGCDSTINIVLKLKKSIVECLVLNNAFTPNGDGINDYWILYRYHCFKRMDVNVYNRYGSRVYHSGDYKNDWYGLYQDKPVPDGTYYFVIKIDLFNGKQYVVKGNVTILR